MSKYPILFPASARTFSGHGIGVLSDAVSCVVTSEINGIYDLEMIYPIDGLYASQIVGRSIIYAEASPLEGRQPFRVHDIIKRMGGKISISAHHVSYDLSGIPVSSINASGSEEAFEQLKTNSVIENPFTFSRSKVVEDRAYWAQVPKSARSRLLDKNESIISTYGGELRFDHFTVEYLDRLGSDKNYRIRYGVNLVDITQEKNFDSLYTGIYPYYRSGENQLELSDKVLYAEGDFDFSRIQVVNLSSEFDEMPGEELLLKHAEKYITDKKIGVPTVSINLSHEHLARFGEFCNAPSPENIELGDTVWVDFAKYGISATARINTVKYDSLKKRYISIAVGDVKEGFIKTLAGLKASKGDISTAKRDASAALGGASEAEKSAQAAQGTAANALLAAEKAQETADGCVTRTELSSGVVLPTENTSGVLIKTWRTTPYTGGGLSPVVTKADLIALGLISE